MNTPAHCRIRTKTAQAFSRREVLIVVACLAILAAVLLPAWYRQTRRASHVSCAGDIKQICLSSIVWSIDNNNRFPMHVPVADGGSLELVGSGMVYPHFRVMSNELRNPMILHCWTDKDHPGTNKWSDISDKNVSYFLNVDAIAVVTDIKNPGDHEGARVLLGDRNITNRPPAGSRLVPVTKASTLAWTKDLHSGQGYVGFTDGRVGLFTNRITGLARAGNIGEVAAAVDTAIQLPDGITNRFAVP